MTYFIMLNTVGKLKRIINVSSIIMVSKGFEESIIYLNGSPPVEVVNNVEDVINRISKGSSVIDTDKIK